MSALNCGIEVIMVEYGSQVIFGFTCCYIFLGLFSTNDDLVNST